MTLEHMLDRFRLRISRRREARSMVRRREQALAQAIDRVVKASAPVVASLRNCRRDLRSPVDNALAYIAQAIDAIPGPVRLSPENWDRDPLLRALFVSPGELSSLTAADPRLRSYFAEPDTARAFALLTATKVERTIFTTAVDGEIARRDVPQTAVEFHDLRILDPAATEDATRCGLRDRVLNALVTQALARLLQLRALKEELKDHQHILSIMLRLQQTRPGMDGRKADKAAAAPAAPAGQQVLADIDRQIRELAAESGSPADYLRQLTAVLNAPQEVFRVAPVVMRMNWMGIRLDKTSTAGVEEIRLAEVDLQGRLKRVAVLVAVAREDCLRR
jgi:hypothetical protein